MIWALLVWYMFGGAAGGISGSMLTPASVEQVKRQVATAVQDRSRADAAGSLLREFEGQVKAFESTFARFGEQSAKAYREHAGADAQALAAVQALDAEWDRHQGRVLDVRFKLRDLLTEKEWAALFGNKPSSLESAPR